MPRFLKPQLMGRRVRNAEKAAEDDDKLDTDYRKAAIELILDVASIKIPFDLQPEDKLMGKIIKRR